MYVYVSACTSLIANIYNYTYIYNICIYIHTYIFERSQAKVYLYCGQVGQTTKQQRCGKFIHRWTRACKHTYAHIYKYFEVFAKWFSSQPLGRHSPTAVVVRQNEIYSRVTSHKCTSHMHALVYVCRYVRLSVIKIRVEPQQPTTRCQPACSLAFHYFAYTAHC